MKQLLFLLAISVFGQTKFNPATEGLVDGCLVTCVDANGTVGLVNVTQPPYFASGSSATTTTVGTTPVGASVTLSDATSFKAGYGITIAGAGPSGATYFGSVVSASGSVLTITPATSTSVSAGAVVRHDDTAALQAAITAAGTAGGGALYLPAGFYRVNGALQDTSGANGKLIMPNVPYIANPPTPLISISIIGSSTQGLTGSTVGTIIQTDGTTGALISGFSADTGQGPFTNVKLTLDNLLLRSYDNPSIVMVNAGNIAGLEIGHLVVDTGFAPLCGYFPGCTFTEVPTHSNGIGVITPNLNNIGTVLIHELNVHGYYTHLWAQEHANVNNFFCLWAVNCIIAQSGGHSIHFNRVELEEATNGITSNGVLTVLTVSNLSGQNVTTMVNDSANWLEGTIAYRLSQDPVTVSGGKRLNLISLIRQGFAPPTISGCGATVGTQSVPEAGYVTSGTSGTCSFTLTFEYASKYAWSCQIASFSGVTTMFQSAWSSTTADFTGTTSNGEVLHYNCRPF